MLVYHHHPHYHRVFINITFDPGIFSVGAPIKIPKVEHPTEEEINKFHAEYIMGLEDVFENHKLKYGISKDVHLEIC